VLACAATHHESALFVLLLCSPVIWATYCPRGASFDLEVQQQQVFLCPATTLHITPTTTSSTTVSQVYMRTFPSFSLFSHASFDFNFSSYSFPTFIKVFDARMK
jgi:hypothetical protein